MEKPKIILSLFFSKIRELESLRKGYYDMENTSGLSEQDTFPAR